jgi:hypothetical protein
MEMIRKTVSADILTPIFDLPWASGDSQVKVIVFPTNKEHFSTKERIVAFCDTMDDGQLSEIDWGKPQGKEIW